MKSREESIDEFVQRLPKTETHLHLEGALPWRLLCEANPGKYAHPPDSWQPGFRFRDFAHFEGELLGYAEDYFKSPERYHECAKAVFAGHVAANVKYLETSFASGCIDFMKLDGQEVCDAIRAAVPEGLEVRIFLGIHHDGWTPNMAPVLERALCWENLDGIDLHGPEDAPLGDWSASYWKRARDAGKFTKAHAGEFLGPAFVKRCVEDLGVSRIEHGVRSIEDPEVVSFLRDHGVDLDICPISNLKLGVLSKTTADPIRALLAAGIICTVSTDDPISFGNSLGDDYRFLADGFGFSRRELAQLARNGFEVALISPDRKAPHLATIASMV
jgi:adenine deaminase